MSIELATTVDIDALVELRLLFLEADHGALSADMTRTLTGALPGYFREHMGHDLFCVVAREDGLIVSCAFLQVVNKPPSPAFPSGKTGTVLNVYTRPEYRRRGLARRVMLYLIDQSRALDICAMNLRATDAGYPIYRSVGFVDDVNKYHPMKWNP